MTKNIQKPISIGVLSNSSMLAGGSTSHKNTGYPAFFLCPNFKHLI